MPRFRAVLLAVLVAGLIPLTAPAAELAGSWKVRVLDQGEQPTLWIVKLEQKDGKWTGAMVAHSEDVPEVTLNDLSVTADRVTFTLKEADGTSFAFDGKLPKEAAATIKGSVFINRTLFPAQLEPTKLTSLDDQFEVSKEIASGTDTDLRYFNATLYLLRRVGDKKPKPEEVRGWAEKAFKAAEIYGPRWQRDIATRMADALARQDGYADQAVNYARRAERLLEPKDTPGAQYRVLNTLATALQKAGKTDEHKEVEARLDKIPLGVKAEKFAGRKKESDRVVLVELFTGVQCPGCAAAGLAADGLIKTYKPSEVVVLEYHLHAAGPSPLTNQDTLDRADAYGDALPGTPTVFFNGRPLNYKGGPVDDAAVGYNAFRRILDEMVEEAPKAKLKATAVQKGNKIDIKAEVSDLEKTGDNIRLRVALVEDEVRYAGGNMLRSHRHVVRAMPGGVKGMAMKNKTGKQEVSVDLEELKKDLKKYLDDFTKKEDATFPNPERPMDLKNLKVVAFVQDDRTLEVLQAVQVDVKSE